MCEMTKIGVVGDLSGGDPARLSAVLDSALIACDYVVQVGDLMPAYEQVRSRVLTSGYKFFPVPGNHDAEYDSIGCAREWKYQTSDGLTMLIGLDNSTGRLTETGKSYLGVPKTTPYEFVFAHMPPCPIVLPDGNENRHGMVEGGENPDADWLVETLKDRADAMFAGHYHGFTVQFAPWGPLIVDGRGGAAPELAYSLITVTPNGWVIHSVGV
jgi:predicted phosphodiesterase